MNRWYLLAWLVAALFVASPQVGAQCIPAAAGSVDVMFCQSDPGVASCDTTVVPFPDASLNAICKTGCNFFDTGGLAYCLCTCDAVARLQQQKDACEQGCLLANAQPLLPYCPAGQFRSAPATRTIPRRCSPVTACLPTEFESSPPSATSDRSCSAITSCLPDELEVAAATATSDTVCAALPPCPGGQYDARTSTASPRNCIQYTSCAVNTFESVAPTTTTDRTCDTLTTCNISQFESTPATATSDRVCSTTRACNTSQFESVDATATSDRVCSALTVCNSTQYETAVPTAASDRTCTSLSVCSSAEFEAVPATATSDRTCAMVRGCSGSEFETVAPTRTSNRVCGALTTCNTTQFEAVLPTSTSDRGCSTLTACNATTQFESTPATATSDRGCSTLTACNATTQFESTPATATSDRGCSTLTACNATTQFESTPATATSDRGCSTLTACNATTQFESTPATATSDRGCSTLTACNATTQFESTPATATSDRVCSTTQVCASSQFESTPATTTSDRGCSPCRTVCEPGRFQLVACSQFADTQCANLTVCAPTEVETVAATATSDRVCLTVASALPLAQFEVPGIGRLRGLPRPSGPAMEETSQDVTLLQNKVAGSSGTVTARVGDRTASYTQRTSARAAVRVVGVLNHGVKVWHDGPRVAVLALATDDLFYATAGAAVVLRVTPGFAGASALSGACTTAGTAGAGRGSCTAVVAVPASWFGTGVRTATVEHGLQGQALAAQQYTVELQPRPSFTISDGVTMEVPHRPVYVSEEFEVAVLAETGGFAVNSWQFGFRTTPGVTILSVAVDPAVWSAQSQRVNATRFLINASPTNPAGRPELATLPEELCRVRFRVLSGTQAGIECEVLALFNVKNVATRASRAEVVDRAGVGRVGTVTISGNPVVGAVAWAAEPVLVNRAVLTTAAVETALHVLFSREAGTVVEPSAGACSADATCAAAAAGLVCSAASGTSVVTVAAGCSLVRLTGAEVRGSGRESIAVTLGSVPSFGADVKVWHPDLPVQLTASDVSLGVLTGFQGPGCSGPRFQGAELRAQAVFTAGAESATAEVTELLQGRLVSSDARVVAVSGRRLSGLAPGSVQITTSNAVTAPLAVVVTTAAVGVRQLEATVVESVSLRGPGRVGSTSDVTVVATLGQRLTREFQRALVYVTALLDDATRVEVELTDGLELSSTLAAVVAVSGQEVEARGSGTGPLVAVRWLDVCSNQSRAATVATVDVALPAPARVLVSATAGRIAVAGAPATQVGVASSSGLTVAFEFADGTTQDVTRDARTVYQVAGGSTGLLQVSSTGLVQAAAGATASSFGAGEIRVSFLQTNLTALQTVVLVGVQGVDVAVRSFPGANPGGVTELNPIAGTGGVYQRAELSVVVRLTDGTSSGEQGRSSAVQLADSARVVEFGAGGAARNVVSVLAGQIGTAQVVATFAGSVRSGVVAIAVVAAEVTVRSVDGVRMSRGTLQGLRNVATVQVLAGVTLSDGTVWSSGVLFPSNTLALPGLLNFSISDTGAATVDPATGLVTLRANKRLANMVTVMSTAGPAPQSGTAGFFCNLDPEVGDVDLGVRSQAPLGAARVGQTVVVPVRINTGASDLLSVDLIVDYDAGRLRPLPDAVVAGRDLVGGDLNFNVDTAGVVQFGGTLSATRGPRLELYELQFLVTGAGPVVLGGEVVVLGGVGGSLLATRGTAFVAGAVSFDAMPARRRRSLADAEGPGLLPAGPGAATPAAADGAAAASGRAEARRLERRARQRRAGEVECSTGKPCAVCPNGRQTGDTDGDCLFDVRDVSFLKAYLNYRAAGESDPAVTGQRFAQQLAEMDADGNGVIGTQDADYLVRANFGLLHFVQALTVGAPVLPGCRLELRVRAIRGGSGNGDSAANPAQTFVYFDLESSDARLAAQLAGSAVTLGSRALPVSKGPTHSGTLFRAVPLGNGTFGVDLESQLELPRLGVSIIQGTVDPSGVGRNARTSALMAGLPDAPFEFAGAYNFSLAVGVGTEVSFLSPEGYNPLAVATGLGSSRACFLRFNCSAGEYEAAPANSSRAAVCAVLTACSATTQFESTPATATSDRGCSTLTACNATTQFESTPATATSDRGCSTLTACNATTQFESTPATATSDRGCSTLTACNATTQFESTPATATSDRVCSTTQVCASSQFESTPATTTSDRGCSPCRTVCEPGRFQLVACSQFADTQCANLTVCAPTEVETVAATATSDRVCLTVASALPLAQFEVPGIGRLRGLPRPSGPAMEETSQDVTLLQNKVAGSSGTVTARVGDRTASYTQRTSARAAVRVVGVLNHGVKVWHDGPRVAVLALATDDLFYATAGAAVVLRVTPGFAGASALSGACTTAGTAGAGRGSCTAVVAVPASWFGTGVRTATVEHGLQGQALAAQQYTVELQPRPSFTISDGVTMEVPHRPVYVSEEFEVAVLAETGGFAVNSWQFGFRTTPGVTILSVAVDPAVWSAQSQRVNATRFLINASPTNPAGRPELATLPEELCRVRFRVLSGTQAGIECEVLALFNVKNVATRVSRAEVVDRAGVGRVGTVTISGNPVVGAVAWAAEPVLVNRAVLTTAAVETALHVLFSREAGTVVEPSAGACSADATCAAAAAGLVCSAASGTSVVTVAAGCSLVRLTGAEVRGSGRESIAVTLGSVPSFGADVKVWHPDLPVQLTASDVSLGVLTGFQGPGCSGPRFQGAELRAQAVFTAGAESATAEVTELLQGRLVSSDARVVAVSGRRLSGLAPGSVQITTSNAVTAPLAVVVTAAAVGVRQLEATVVESVSLRGPGRVGSTSDVTVVATLGQRLTREFQRALVYVTALLDDATRVEVELTDGLELSSTLAAVVAVSGQEVEARGSGTGPLVAVRWLDVCSNQSRAATVATVDVALPAPARVLVSATAGRIAVAGAPATQVGVASSSGLTVAFEFADGTTQDVTRDARTVYQVAGGSTGLLQVSSTGLVQAAAGATASSFGAGEIRVSFLQTNLTALQTVVLVGVQGVDVAVRSFPGANPGGVTELNPIAGTGGVYQRAELSVVVRLTDGTSSGEQGRSSAVQLADSARVVEFGAGGAARNVVSVLAGQIGTAQVVATFAGSVRSGVVAIAVVAAEVTVRSVDGVRMSRGTLQGLRNVATVQVLAGVTLSDGTVWSSGVLFPSNTLALPGLLNFSISDTGAATVDPATGLVTLRANKRLANMVTVMSTAGPAPQSGTAGFFCNLDPEVGDVDLGVRSQAPLGAARVGQTVVVPVRINTGASDLLSVDLIVDYDAGRLRPLPDAVVAGRDLVGGDLNFNVDTAGVVQFGGTLSATRGPRLELYELQFLVTGAGPVVLGGEVVVLGGVGGSLLATRGTAFVAGAVSFDAMPARRRRSLADAEGPGLLPAGPGAATPAAADGAAAASGRAEARRLERRARQRRAGEVECSTGKPCAVCPNGRQTGDTDGDCLFDVRDVSFLKAYLNYRAAGESDPAVTGQRFAQQLAEMDADGNGVIGTQDADYLVRANFGLLHFVQALTVGAPVLPGCRLELRVRAIRGGSGNGDSAANPAQTFVYFDLESSDARLAAQLAGSAVTLGSRALPVSKGPTHSGTLFRAVPLGNGTFGVDLESQLELPRLGVSIIQGTVDPSGVGRNARTSALMAGLPDAPFEFAGAYNFSLAVGVGTEVSFLSPEGYNPLAVATGLGSSRACFLRFNCSAGEYEAAPANSSRAAVCAVLTACSATTQFESTPATATSDRGCSTLTACNATTQFESTPATATSDRGCSTLTACNATTQFESTPATATSDRGCSTLTACNATTQFESTPATATSDRGCSTLTACNATTQFESTPATATSDRGCSTLTACNATTQFESTPATATSDRVCSTTQVCASSQFESTPATTTSDRGCSPCRTVCEPGRFQLVACSQFADTQCANLTVCAPTEVETVAATATSDRVCLTVASALPLAQFEVPGIGRLRGLPRPSGPAMEETSQDVTLLQNKVAGSSGTVTARVGDRTASYTQRTSARAAVRVVGVLNHGVKVWHDGPRVAVLALATDDLFYATAGAAVVLRVTPGFAGASALSGACTTAGTAGAGRGSCTAVVAVPASWFGTGVRTATVEHGLQGQALAAQQYTVELQPRPSFTISDGVTMEVPHRPVYVSEEFEVAVLAETGGFAVNSWQFGFRTTPGVTILSVAVDPAVWSAQSQRVNATRFLINASPTNPAGRPELATLPEELCRVRFRVLSGTQAGIECEVLALFNVKNVATRASRAEVVDRAGVGRVGTVTISGNPVVGAVAWAAEPVLVNRAVLTTAAVETALHVLFSREAGTVVEPSAGACSADATCAAAAAGLVCSAASGTSVVTVAAGCSLVRLTGAEVRGSGRESIAVTLGSVPSFGADVKVWHPDLPVQLTASDVSLGVLTGFQGPGCSGPRFQGAELRAQAVFTAGAESATAEVTELLQGRLVSSDARVVAVSGRRLSGLAPGSVQITTSNAVTAPLAVVVTTAAVGVRQLEATVVESVSLRGPGRVGSTSDVTVVATLGQRLTREFQRALVYVTALLDDATRVEVELTDGLELSSTLAAVVAVSGQEVEARGSGTGPLVAVRWLDVCSNQSRAATVATVDVALPAPARVLVSATAGRIAVAGAPATQVGVASSSGLTVAFEFADGTTQDVTRDARTVYQVAGGSTGLLQVSSTGLVQAAAGATASSFGAGEIRVSFLQTNLTALQTVVLVGVQGVDVAVRSFPGANPGGVTELNPIAGTGGVYQRAELSVVVRLTDGTSSGEQGRSSAVQLADSARVVEFGAGGAARNVVSVLAGQIGTAQVVATFAGSVRSGVVAIAVVAAEVTVRSVDGVRMSRGTLQGLRNVATVQVLAGVTLSDGTVWSSGVLFPSNTLALPGLLNFSISDTGAATVDPATGLVTLRANKRLANMVTVMSTAGPAPQSGTAGFFCNLDPEVGDVDLGVRSQAPLGAARVGQTVVVPVRINTGASDLLSVDLIVDYDAGRLRPLPDAVVAGRDLVGGDLNFNVDTAGVVQFGGTLSATRGPRLELYELQFLVTGAGPVVLGGEVVVLGGVGGSLLATRGTAFVAGAVSFDAMPARRRRSLADAEGPGLLPAGPGAATPAAADGAAAASGRAEARRLERRARQRRAGEVECSTGKPCAVCPNGRQTGDTDGDCLFDVRDVSFLKAYLNYRAAGESDPAVTGQRFAQQLAEMDADGNGVIGTQDADYLVRANFGLLHFVQALTVGAPVLPGCRLELRVRAIRGGSGNGDSAANPAQTFVYFDLESSDARLAAQLAGSAVTLGSRALPVSKGPTHSGTLFRAVPLGNGTFGVDLESQLELPRLGVSIIQGTVDPSGVGRNARTSALMAGLPDAPFEFAGAYNFSLAVGVGTEVSFLSPEGYNPLAVATGLGSSRACFLRFNCSAGEYEAAPANSSRAAVCAAHTVCAPSEFESAAPTSTSDRGCTLTTVCELLSQYEVEAPSDVSDRQCAPVSPPCEPGLFESTPATSTSDRVCDFVSECADEEIETSEPTALSDRVCASRLSRSSGDVQMAALGFGCVIAAAVLLVVALAFVCIRELRDVQGHLLLHFFLAAFAAVLVAAVQVDRAANPFQTTVTDAECTAVGALVHQLFLVGFAWGAIKMVRLAQMATTFTSRNDFSGMALLYLIGWVLPTGLVLVCLGLDPGMYVDADHCWIKHDLTFLGVFAGPIVVLSVVALVAAAVAHWRLTHGDVTGFSPVFVSQRRVLRWELFALLGLLALFAADWVLLVLSVQRGGFFGVAHIVACLVLALYSACVFLFLRRGVYERGVAKQKAAEPVLTGIVPLDRATTHAEPWAAAASPAPLSPQSHYQEPTLYEQHLDWSKGSIPVIKPPAGRARRAVHPQAGGAGVFEAVLEEDDGKDSCEAEDAGQLRAMASLDESVALPAAGPPQPDCSATGGNEGSEAGDGAAWRSSMRGSRVGTLAKSVSFHFDSNGGDGEGEELAFEEPVVLDIKTAAGEGEESEL